MQPYYHIILQLFVTQNITKSVLKSFLLFLVSSILDGGELPHVSRGLHPLAVRTVHPPEVGLPGSDERFVVSHYLDHVVLAGSHAAVEDVSLTTGGRHCRFDAS